MTIRLLAVSVCLLSALSNAQQRVDSRNLHERIMVVVPVQGQGTYADPKRPLLAPKDASASPNGILSWSFELSDDGNFALVELVARDKAAFKTLLADPRIVKSFEKGKHRKEDIELEFKKLKKSFELEKFAGRKP